MEGGEAGGLRFLLQFDPARPGLDRALLGFSFSALFSRLVVGWSKHGQTGGGGGGGFPAIAAEGEGGEGSGNAAVSVAALAAAAAAASLCLAAMYASDQRRPRHARARARASRLPALASGARFRFRFELTTLAWILLPTDLLSLSLQLRGPVRCMLLMMGSGFCRQTTQT
jgi:hypothetical protein